MNDFTNCPKCNKPLLNEIIVSRRNRQENWRKSCIAIDHGFWVLLENEVVAALTISLDINKDITANWVPGDTPGSKQQLYIVHGKNVDIYKHGIWIPYFEPDLSQYDKLIAKCKTYLTFS